MKYPLIQKDTKFDAVILADGEYPVHETALNILEQASTVVCCDGAARQYSNKPYAIIGDGDSLSMEFKKEHADIFHQIEEQEDNDLTKATRFIVQSALTENRQKKGNTQAPKFSIAYLGCTGKREDHTLGNISLMMRYYKELGISPTLITNYGYFVPVSKDATLETFPRQQVSIFNFGCKELKSNGLKWNSYPYESWWQGSLNEAIGDEISFKADSDYLVFRTFEAK